MIYVYELIRLKNRKKKYFLRRPYIEELGLGVGMHIVSFNDLKQLIEWYLGDRYCASMEKSGITQYGEDVKEVKWKSIPLLLAKKNRKDIWFETFEKIFEPDIEELRKRYERISNKNKFAPSSFEKYLKIKVNGLNTNRSNALKTLEKEYVNYFVICESEQVIIR